MGNEEMENITQEQADIIATALEILSEHMKAFKELAL